MNKKEAQERIVAEFLRLPEKERTDSAATALAFKCQDAANILYFNDYQAIMGWLGRYIVKRQ